MGKKSVIDPENYLLFIVACLLLVIIPGQDMAFYLGRTLSQGKRAGYLAVAGINVGAYVHLLAALLGLSAIIATSTLLFFVVKIVGACYLVWLGVHTLFKKAVPLIVDRSDTNAGASSIFLQGFLCNLLNPKVVVFYFTFMPQFVAVASPHYITQLVIFGVTLNVIALCGNLLLVFFFSYSSKKLTASQKVNQWLSRAMGAIFISLGLKLATEKL